MATIITSGGERGRYGRYRESYVEKDRCVRNSTTAAVPGVDVMRNFQLTKQEFERVFLDAAERFENSTRFNHVKHDDNGDDCGRIGGRGRNEDMGKSGRIGEIGRSGRIVAGKIKGIRGRKERKVNADDGTGGGKVKDKMVNVEGGTLKLRSAVVRRFDEKKGDGDRKIRKGGNTKKGDNDDASTKKSSLPRLSEYGGRDIPIRKGAKVGGVDRDAKKSGRAKVGESLGPGVENFGNVARAAGRRADGLRRLAAGYQGKGQMPMAGSMFEQAIDTRSRFGLHCTLENGDAHVEYAQNLSKRGLIAEAEYHLRTAADIYRQQNALTSRKYADILLYLAVIIDRQGRLVEAEAFYRAALAVYRRCKLGDDNVRVAIDNFSNNLRAQGRGDEVDFIIKSHFNGPLAPSPRRRR